MTAGKPESKSYCGSGSESSQLPENEEISAAAFHTYSLPSFPLTFWLCCKKETQMVESCPSYLSLHEDFLTHCTYWAHLINQHFLSTPLWTAKAVMCFKIRIKTVSALKWSNSSYLSNSSLRPKYFYGQPQNTIRFITTAALTCTSTVPAWRVFLGGSWIFYVQTLQCVTQIPSSTMDIHGVTNVGTPSESRVCPVLFRN